MLNQGKVTLEMKRAELTRFLVLYDEVFPSLYAYFSRRVATKREVHELVKRTFLLAVSEVQHNFSKIISWKTWFYKQAYGVFSNRQKKEKGCRKYLVAERERPFSYQDNFIRDLFKEFSVFEAELVCLKYFEKLSNIEIAYIVGLTHGEVGGHLYKVMKKAQNLMHQY